MQLGELQSQFDRFENRGASIVALSVDAPNHSRSMIRRLELTYPVVSDQDQAVMQAYSVQNPETNELALHAVYVVDTERRIFYRKVAGRRPVSQELLDAIDYFQGEYPRNDEPNSRGRIPVAFPTNNFQAIIEIGSNSDLPEEVDPALLRPIIARSRAGDLDEATIAYRTLAQVLTERFTEAELLSVAAWYTKTALRMPEEAIQTGRLLGEKLAEQRALREAGKSVDQVEAELDEIRTLIRTNADAWRLRAARSTLRGYRELSRAAYR